jgi:hypothetical protein
VPTFCYYAFPILSSPNIPNGTNFTWITFAYDGKV